MQNDFQLTVGAMRRRLRSCYPHQEVVTLEDDGPVRATYAEVLSSALNTFTGDPELGPMIQVLRTTHG